MAGASPTKRLRVGTSGDYAPFSRWPEEAARPDGFSIDVAEAYAASRQIEIEWQRFRWPELAGDLSSGRFEMAISGITVRPDRSIQALFSSPLTVSGAVVLVPTGLAERSPRELDDASIRLAVNAGGHLERVTRRLFPAARIEAVPDNSRVLERLREGRADGVVTDTLEAPHWQSQVPGLQAIGPLTRDRKAAWFRIEAADRLHDFDRWLLSAESSGSLSALRRRHGLPETQTAAAGPALLARIDERLSLMPDVADVKVVLGLPIEDRPREARVLDEAARAVEQIARDAGTTAPPREAVRRLFRAQIEAAKWIQQRRVGERMAALDAGKGGPAETDGTTTADARRRLDQALRPALIGLGDRISMLLVESLRTGAEAPSLDDVSSALAERQLPEDQLRALHAALSAFIRSAARTGSAPRPGPEATDTAPSA